jgi:4'-phosphopantetheinyl transferase
VRGHRLFLVCRPTWAVRRREMSGVPLMTAAYADLILRAVLSDVRLLAAREGEWLRLLDVVRPHIAAQEVDRARRFVYQRDRLCFLVGRGLLRLELGRLLGREPSALVLTRGASGKPVCPQAGQAGVAFNVSHCEGLVVVGVAHRSHLGVDAERVVDAPVVTLLAPRVCTRSEQRLLDGVEPARRGLLFSLLWTRKEAVLKAIGCGLRRDPRSVDVASGLHDSDAWERPWCAPADVEGFRVRSWMLGRTHALSTALEGR